MRTIPQEIVDMVIDQLADQCELQSEKIMILEAQSPPQEPTDMATGQLVDHEPQYRSISYFSTVSRHWLARTQKYHFESVWFMEEDYPERWRANIEPNPSGVSRYVRELRWIDFDDFDMQVKDFDAHLRAFTRIEVLVFDGGDILLERSAVEAFAPMGSSLVRLEVDATSTTLKIFASLLAALPRLRHLRAHRLGIYQDDDDKALFPPRIPFFENANSLDLLLDEDSAGPLDWIPPSVRFHDLRIDTLCIIDERGRVEGWIASSASNLKYFSISEHVKGPPFLPLDLSGCTGLETLRLGIMSLQPGALAGTVIPSLHSLLPPRIVLDLGEIDSVMEVDFQAWDSIGMDLCLLAERFKTIHAGRKMEVKFTVCDGYGRFIPVIVELFRTMETMVKLREGASVVIEE